jgi:hypothetical protein
MFRYSTSRNPRRGSTILLFAMMLPTVIIPMVGLGIDATMLYIVQAKLSAAADGAALGAGRLLGTQADPAEIAGEFLKANFRANAAGFWGAQNLNPTINVTLGTTKTITVNATVEVPLIFARIFGQPTATVSAKAVSTRRDSRIVLVIDRSGSMNTNDGAGSTVIADVVSYAQSFVGKFTPGVDQMGLVIFDGSSLVGYPTTRPWDNTVTASSTGGPDTSFADGTTNDMLHQIRLINANHGTGMADALSVAYIELQKGHMKEVAAKGFDDRLNSIVLFTDGVPTAISLNLNNPTMIKSTSTCTYKSSTQSSQKMQAWYAIPGTWPPFSDSDGAGVGVYMLATLDTSHTAAWWMNHAGSDAAAPIPTGNFAGCTNNTVTESDFTTIPAADMYGNDLTGTGYTTSHVVDSSGRVSSVYTTGSPLDRSQKTNNYHWSLAMWNAVDSAAARIRSDVNYPNRPGDPKAMQIGIYTIGYMGSGGTDDALLKRVANDKASTSYNANQATGLYVPANNPTALSSAFNTIASVLLRLAQ